MIGKIKKYKRVTSMVTAVLLLLSTFLPTLPADRAHAAYPATHVVISTVYGAGGNANALFTNDFVELYNPTNQDVDLTGWKVGYASAAGTSYNNIPLSGKIAANGYYLVTAKSGGAVGAVLPTADASNTGVDFSGSAGKVRLVDGTDTAVDLLGYGTTAVGGEGTPTANLSAANSATRRPYANTNPAPGKGNAWDTDNNKDDFYVGGVVTPRNTQSPTEAPMVPQISLQPKGNLSQFFLNGTLATVKGLAGAVVANSTVSVYASASKGTALTTTTANADGSYSVTYTASGSPTAVYVAAATSGLAESATTQLNVAAASNGVTVAKLGYSVAAGTGTLIGNTGSATANAIVNIYSDSAKTTNLVTVTAGASGDFTATINNAPDTVYVAQTTVTANGIMLEGDAAAITKADTNVVTAIKDARAYDNNGVLTNLNKTFTIEGVATVDNQVLGTQKQNFYIQDSTGGINIFSTSYDAGFKVLKGDRIRVTGNVINYSGLAEFDATSIIKISEGNALPAAKPMTILDSITFATAEPVEGTLITLTGKVTASATSGTSAWNVTFTDDNNKATTLRVMNSTGIVPDTDLVVGKSYTITGIQGQFDGSSPYTTGYQIYPRDKKDISPILQITHTALTQVYTATDVQFEANVQGADSVILYYRASGTTNYTAVPMADSGAGRYVVTLAKANVPQNGFEYYLEAKQGVQTKTAGSSSAPYAVTLIADTFGPDYGSEEPQDATKIETPRPEISVLLSDPSGVNANSVHFFLDGQEITAPDATINQSQVKYTPTADLDLGKHTVKVTAEDTKGNASEKAWIFEIVPRFTGGNHYRGTTHNHTNISHDAAGSPEDALKVTEDKYHYDFFAFTDHSHDIDPSLLGQDTVNHTGSNGVTMQERSGGEQWQLTKDLAKKYTKDGSYVVFPAFEMTSTTWGHSNVFGTQNFIDRNLNGKQYQDLNKYYAWVLTYDDIVAQFNHPDMSANAFNNFKPYDKNVDKLFTMLEVGNGSGHYAYANAEGKFFSALDLGWHVAPTYGEDNHDGTWGQTNARTVIVSKDLSQESLLQSMKNMRVYMEEDPNFTLDVLANGYYMGSIVDSKTLKFNISGNDPVAEAHNSSDYDYLPTTYKSDDRIAKVELITNGGKVVNSITPMTKDFTWSPEYTVTSGQQWFVVKVTQADGERIYSAPIWSKEQSVDVKVNSVDLDNGVVVGGNPAPLTATVANNGTETINNLKVDFYYDSVDATHFIGSQDIASILSKSSAPAKATWANPLTGDHNIIVKVTSKDGLDIGNVVFTLPVKIKAPLGIKVLIDAFHANENTTTDPGTYKDNLKAFTLQMQKEGYTVLENKQALTDAVLSDVKVLVFTHSATALSDAERTAVANFVKNGGSLLMTAKSNNGTNDPTVNNQLLADIGTQIRFGNDGAYDLSKSGNFWGDPTVSPWAVKAYPGLVSNYVTDRVDFVQFYSGSTLTGPNNTALTENGKLTFLLKGNETTYQTNVKNGSYVYDNVSDDHGGSAIPLIASDEVGQGRVIVSGMNFFNDKQMDESYNPVGNDELAINSINWLANRGTTVTKIADARKLSDDTDVVVEGTVTTAAGVFFDAFYLQDDTSGIMAFLEVPDGSLKAGDKVRVYGHLKTFENNKELEFTSFAKDVIKIGSGTPVAPKLVPTGDSTIDANLGLLVKVKGTVISQYDENSYVIDDGSGPVIVFTDGYIVNQSGPVPVLIPGESLEAVGLSGSFAQGKRIRVRDTKELIGIKDKTAPLTISNVDPNDPTGANGWYNSDVIVTLQASDSATGVKSTQYRINSGEWLEYVGPLVLSTDGKYSIEYYSVDQAGNKEITQSINFSIDKTLPVTNAQLDGQTGNNGWYTSNVAVKLTANDNLSGVATSQYSFDGQNWSNYTGIVQLTENGKYTIYYRSIDTSGNYESTKTIDVKIDKTAPTLNVSVDLPILSVPNHKLIDIKAFLKYSDSTSGIESVVLELITVNEANALPNDIDGAAYGTMDTAFKLRADRSGSGNGRIYTITYLATDKAGNTTRGTATVTVPRGLGNN
jgi:DNA/RNA endonuclease YhcR with UshA esterase domain